MVKAMGKAMVKYRVSRWPGPKGGSTDNESKLDEALSYIHTIQEIMGFKAFRQFCRILTAYMLHQINLPTVGSLIKSLFIHQLRFILEFNKYLPRENVIVLDEADPVGGEVLGN
ncbi:hypothetical protein R1flu_001654 [Riccia fluitans]|uniref:Uncharacterized protein n=1 Tax=Riccia fluitans TaxID=41844 RepID=A0ABD1Y3V8_9MARC